MCLRANKRYNVLGPRLLQETGASGMLFVHYHCQMSLVFQKFEFEHACKALASAIYPFCAVLVATVCAGRVAAAAHGSL